MVIERRVSNDIDVDPNVRVVVDGVSVNGPSNDDEASRLPVSLPRDHIDEAADESICVLRSVPSEAVTYERDAYDEASDECAEEAVT